MEQFKNHIKKVTTIIIGLLCLLTFVEHAYGWDGDNPTPIQVDRAVTAWMEAERLNNEMQLTQPPPPPATFPAYIWPWDDLQQCESGHLGWTANTGNGYYGGLQFSLTSWRGVGGTGYPHQATRQEQIYRGEKLQDIQGWGAWPACSRKIGLR
jgi:hypothetical protein